MLYLNLIGAYRYVLYVAGGQSHCQCYHPHSCDFLEKIWEFWKNSVAHALPKGSEICYLFSYVNASS